MFPSWFALRLWRRQGGYIGYAAALNCVMRERFTVPTLIGIDRGAEIGFWDRGRARRTGASSAAQHYFCNRLAHVYLSQ
jgi:hypothetical protein